MINDLPVFLCMIMALVVSTCGSIYGFQKGYRLAPVILLLFAALIAYGLYTQCPGVAVYRRC